MTIGLLEFIGLVPERTTHPGGRLIIVFTKNCHWPGEHASTLLVWAEEAPLPKSVSTTLPRWSTFCTWEIPGKLPSQVVSAWKTSAPEGPAVWGGIRDRVQVIMVGAGGGLPLPPLGSQVSPHWNLGPMPPAARAAGTTVKLNAWLAAGAGVVAAWAGAAPAMAATIPPPAIATAMAAPASALLKRDIGPSLLVIR
jgi:hypothetical protein